MAIGDRLLADHPTATPGRAAPEPCVLYCLGEEREAGRVSLGLFGRTLRTWEYAALAGAPASAEILVGVLDGGLYLETRDRRQHEYLAVTLVRLVRCCLIVVNDGFHIYRPSMRGKGLGLRVFTKQLHQAKRMGARRIDTTAGRNPGENGYYTWPRFGFDAMLPFEIRPSLPPDLRHAQTVLDLMESEEGRTWWRQHGTAIEASFDLADHSRSWQVFQRYRAERAAWGGTGVSPVP